MAATYDLKALRAEADRATDMAYNHDWGDARVCVNWGDLCCVSAEHYVTEEGDEGYRVYIEEAAPSNYEFQDFVRAKLDAAGFTGVEVITEW
jgi:hypothetical protein